MLSIIFHHLQNLLLIFAGIYFHQSLFFFFDLLFSSGNLHLFLLPRIHFHVFFHLLLLKLSLINFFNHFLSKILFFLLFITNWFINIIQNIYQIILIFLFSQWLIKSWCLHHLRNFLFLFAFCLLILPFGVQHCNSPWWHDFLHPFLIVIFLYLGINIIIMETTVEIG